MKTLNKILIEIELSNVKYGKMSEDETNERIFEILDGIEDDEESIINAYDQQGFELIREAEQGFYTLRKPTPKQIKQARLDSGLTQTQAAELIHAGLRTWQQWEKGDREMSLANWELFTIKIQKI